MPRLEGLVVLLMLSAVAIGCGKTEGGAEKPTASIQAPSNEQGAAATDRALGPQETVTHYLEAVKAGDEEAVSAMLTEVARRKTTAANIAVAPPGSDTADFSVGDMEYITPAKDTAHVASMWTDQDDQGKPQTLSIVWVVRHEPAGWRIAGMITRIAPDQPLLVLDFEDPEEVIRRQTSAQEAAAKRQPTSLPATGTNPAAAAGRQPDGTSAPQGPGGTTPVGNSQSGTSPELPVNQARGAAGGSITPPF